MYDSMLCHSARHAPTRQNPKERPPTARVMNTNQEKNVQKDAIEVDIKRVFKAVWKRAWLVCLTAFLCAALSLLTTIYLITPEYKSTAMFYVNNGAISIGDTSVSLTSGDITASKSLVETYIVILNTRECLNKVIDMADVDYTYEELKDMIKASSVNETEVFQVVVTSTDSEEAYEIASSIAQVLPKRIAEIVEGTAAEVVDAAVEAAKPSSPNRATNTLVGFLIGAVVATLALAIREIFDITIRTEEDLEQCTKHPVLATVPDMSAPSKSGSYYYYSKDKSKSKGKANTHKADKVSASKTADSIIGKNISFSAFEAYKLLRTKLQFSFVDEIKCPVIGISSSMAGEGKSLSAVNLAYSLSQLEKRVLLIDCDMRRPSLNVKLPIKKNPGLSEYLTGHATMDEATQFCRVDNAGGFAVISSGHNPPNPIELLSSTKMEKAIEQLREYFDYILLDLPPVGEVSDAMVAAKLADGILLVVRQDYCNTAALSSAISQFEFIETRILGIVLNCVNDEARAYYRYGKKYGKYYYRYSKGRYRYSSYYAANRESDSPQPKQ